MVSDETVDCTTKDNRAFNRTMRDSFDRPDLCVKKSYTKAEILKMREQCKRFLSAFKIPTA